MHERLIDTTLDESLPSAVLLHPAISADTAALRPDDRIHQQLN